MIATCADLCNKSYDDAALGFTDVGDLRYGVFNTEHGRIICIRGTANAENWLRDVDVWPSRSRSGYMAHKGFVRAYQALREAGMPTHKGCCDYITGHSFGGGVATLGGEEIGCKIVSFGSPRVYWRFGFAPKLDHIRVVRDDDPVPRVPAIFYSHRCEPLTLKDNDCHLLQIGDHFIKGYCAALERQTFSQSKGDAPCQE